MALPPVLHAMSPQGFASLLPKVALALAYFGGLVGLAYLWQKRWRLRRGRLVADERGLFVEGHLVVARAKLQHAYLLRDGEQWLLRLVRPGHIRRPVDIEVDDEAEAQRVLGALRLDAASSVAEFELAAGTAASGRRKGARLLAAFAGALTAAFALFCYAEVNHLRVLHPLAMSIYLAGAIGGLYAMRQRRVRVSIGADGIFLKQLLVPPRFVAFRDLADVSMEKKDITLHLHDRSTIEVHSVAEDRPGLGTDREKEGAGLVARIREALANYQASPANARGVVFVRGERTAREWIADARALREDAATYRAAAIPDDQLWRLVEDVTASPGERAGAALALRRDLDASGRTRLRLAAEACADKRLRVALETATEEDDDALALALDDVADRRAEGRLRRG